MLENTTGEIESSTYDTKGHPMDQMRYGRHSGHLFFQGWVDNGDGTRSSEYIRVCPRDGEFAFGTWTEDEAGLIVEDHNSGCDRTDVSIDRDELGRPLFEDVRILSHGGSHWKTTWTWNTRADGYAVGNWSAEVDELGYGGEFESHRKAYGTETRDELNRVVETTKVDRLYRSTEVISYLDTGWRIATEESTFENGYEDTVSTRPLDWEWFVCP